MARSIHGKSAILEWIKRHAPCTNDHPLAATDKHQREEPTSISQSNDQENRSEEKSAGKGIKTRRRRSLSNLVHPPLWNDKAYPPREIELADHVYPPLEMEGFPTSETTFFYLRYQEESGQLGGPYKYLPSSQPGGGGVDGALVVLLLAVCGVLYSLFRKRSCFMNCGWKGDDRASDAGFVSGSREMV